MIRGGDELRGNRWSKLANGKPMAVILGGAGVDLHFTEAVTELKD